MFIVFGASGRLGRRVVSRLCDNGYDVVGVTQSESRRETIDPRVRAVVAAFEEPRTIAEALTNSSRVISCAHTMHAHLILDSLTSSCERVVLVGSARRYAAFAAPEAEHVLRAEIALRNSALPGVMLHPTMIYGGADDRTVSQLIRLVRRLPVLPLPDGGRHLVQPIYVDDVADAIVAAALLPQAPGAPIVVAGPKPIPLAEMVRECAAAIGARITLVPVSANALSTAANVTTKLGFRLPFDASAITRAGHDTVFDVANMRTRLGVIPRPFNEGVRRLVAEAGLR